MKKFLPLLTLCMGLCCVSCYDDSALVERIDALEQSTIASLKASISSLESQSGDIKSSIALLERSGNANATEIAALKTSLGAIEAKIEELKSWVEKLLEGYYTKEEIDAQIQSLNTEIETLRTKISSIESKLDILMREFVISFDDTEIGILAGGTTSVGYTITGATEKTTVKALGQNGWSAKVTPDGTDKGKITVTAPNPLTEDEIIVLVYDGEFRTIMSSINFVTGVVTPSQTAVELEAEAGTVDITVTSNLNYKVSIPEDAKNWLSLVDTKATKTETITFAYTANNGNLRRGEVDFTDENGRLVSSIVFLQKKVIVMEDAIDLSANGTANCYMISDAGWYKFDASVKGNSNESVGELCSVELLWETFNTNESPQNGDIISKILLSDDYIYIKTSDSYKKGNALVAVKDINGTILWSWHLWLTDYSPDNQYNTYISGAKMMDRDLGALSSTPSDGFLTNGLYYQWGRKDPFINICDITIEGDRVGWIKAATSKDVETVVETSEITGNVEYATSHPTTIIDFNGASDGDWLYLEKNNSLWDKNKTKYDPCPIGWKIPNGTTNECSEWSGFPSKILLEWDEDNLGVLIGEPYSSPPAWFHVNNNIRATNARYEICLWSCASHRYANTKNALSISEFTREIDFDCYYYKALLYGVRCCKE